MVRIMPLLFFVINICEPLIPYFESITCGNKLKKTLLLLAKHLKSIFIIYLISIYLFYAILVIISGIISRLEIKANILS